MFFSISVVYLKEELKDAEYLVQIEPEMKPLVVPKNGFKGANYSMDEIDIKEEPLQDDLVSELLNNKKLLGNFNWHKHFLKVVVTKFNHVNWL